MEVANTVDAVKKYWPWALGGIALLFLYSRMTGGNTVDDGSGNLSGSLYDPNLLANNLAMSQVAAGIQQAQIVADAQSNQAGWQTIQAGFQFAANANSDFQQGQIASYQAVRDISTSAMQSMSDITAAGLNAAGASTISFNNMVATSTQSAADIVKGVAGANAQTAGGFGNAVSRAVSYGAF